MVLDPFVKILRQTVRLAQSRFDKIFLATEAADRKGIFGSHLKNSRYRSRTPLASGTSHLISLV
jgi:hypothetical protein